MNTIDTLLNQLETNISHCETVNQEISNGNVAWHIEHSLLVLNGITDSLLKSTPDNYKWRFNFIRMMVLTMKKIPRGRAKAPKVVQPKDNINKDALFAHLSLTRDKINALETLPKDSHFNHPFFGDLKLNQTINFLEIHTKHHLNIIEDIITTKQK
jgi:hypothetical protein